MALVKCPECGQEISDKAEKCIYCGFELRQEEQVVQDTIKCEECGATLTKEDTVCPVCGCPVEKEQETEEKPQQVEVASIKITQKMKKSIIAVIVLLVVCVGGGIAYKNYQTTKAAQEYQEAYNTYIDNLRKAQVLMLSSGSDSESLCNLTLKVWSNSIYEERDSETDKYTRTNGGTGWFNEDFNESLSNLYSDSSIQEKISTIEQDQSRIKNLVKEMQDVPEGLDKCYDTMTALYESYKALSDLAVNPTGSLKSFGESKSSAVSDFMSAFETLDNQIPDKME